MALVLPPTSGPGATQPSGPVEPARRTPAGSSSATPRAGAPRCTPRRLNTHGTTGRTLLYPWHPWGGRSVHVHGTTERANATALRCSLNGDAGRCLEVPAWMFEQEACVPLIVASRPRVGVVALAVLRRLLTEISSGRRMGASAVAAAEDSPEQNRGEVHATPPRPAPGNATEGNAATRPVRTASCGMRPARGGLAGAAGGDAAGVEGLGDAPAAGARRPPALRRGARS
jgi:hypothetical protein